MKRKNDSKNQTFHYTEEDIKKSIAAVEEAEFPKTVKTIIIHCLQTCLSINSLLEKNRSLRRLLGRLFGFKTEKKGQKSTKDSHNSDTDNAGNSDNKKGHGRRGHDEINADQTIFHPHPELKNGEQCPEVFCDGKVYTLSNPGIYVRIEARKPITTTIHKIEKLRCNLCGKIFESLPPEVENTSKYDETVLAHLIMCKCYFGMTHHRIATYDSIKASTQSELFASADDYLKGVYDILCVEAINDYIISFDDTKMKIQPEIKGGVKSAWASAFVSTNCVIYSIDRDHAGIVLSNLLEKRDPQLAPILALSDALPSYTKYKEGTIDIHCNVHGRRRFIVASSDDEEFAEEMKSLIGKIYYNDKQCKDKDQSERMEYHQIHSVPIYNEIMDKIQDGIETKRFIPNSEMGKAVEYWSEEINKLSSIVRIPGVLLDTNHVERLIKAPIRIRKQAPIFKTVSGALRVGRMLSLVETARMNKVDPFNYLCWAIKRIKGGSPPIDSTPLMFKRFLEKPQEH